MRSRDECGIGWSKFLLESVFQCPYVYYILTLLSGRLHLHVKITYCFSFIKFRFKSNINNIISKNLNSSISLQFIISLFNMQQRKLYPYIVCTPFRSYHQNIYFLFFYLFFYLLFIPQWPFLFYNNIAIHCKIFYANLCQQLHTIKTN